MRRQTRTSDVDKIAQDYLYKYNEYPDRWADDILGINLWSVQRQILKSVFHNPITAVRACNSVGKTFVAAVAVLAFAYIRTPCKILTTAPTFYQVKDLLWSEINTLYKNKLMKTEDGGGLGFPGKMLTTKLAINDGWFAEGLSPKQAVNFQGYHQKHVLGVFDESPGVRSELVDGAMSLLASGDAHMLHIGNPWESVGHFWDLFNEKKGKKEAFKVARFHISCYDSPNFTGEDVPEEIKRSLIQKNWVEGMIEKYGKDSPICASKCFGDFPEESEYQLIPYHICQEAISRQLDNEEENNKLPKVLSIDVARFGDDMTVYTLRQGRKVLWQEVESNRDNMEIAGRAVSICKTHKDITIVAVDVIGVGAGVVDRLEELRRDGEISVRVIAVNSAERAYDSDTYFNRRAEMWFGAKEWLTSGSIPDSDDLIGDLTSPHYKYHSDGRYIIESKEDIKKRLRKSTDNADSMIIGISTDLDESLGNIKMSVSKSYSTGDLLKQMGLD